MNLLRSEVDAITFRDYITYDMDFQFVPSDHMCFDELSRCD